MAAPGLAPDLALGSTGGLVSAAKQLEAGASPLYDPQGIVVDHLEEAGVDNPVAIEATNPRGLALNENKEIINEAVPTQGNGVLLFELEEHGETVVQQVATQTSLKGSTGSTLTRWPPAVAQPGQAEARKLAEASGPLGIFGGPNGSISLLLSGRQSSSYSHTTSADLIRLNAKLEEPLVVNDAEQDPPPQHGKLHIQGERRAIMGLDPGPFFTDPLLVPEDENPAIRGLLGLFEVRNAGPEVAQLGSGLYAADLRYEASPSDTREEKEHGVLPLWLSYGEHNWRADSTDKKINVGIRLLEPNAATGRISGEKGDSIVNTLGAQAKASPCNIGAEEAALAAGAGDTLWILDRGPIAATLNEALGLRAGREIIELAPGGGEAQACPHLTASETTFRMGSCRPTQSAQQTLDVAKNGPVAFDASSVRLSPTTPFAYEWEIVELEGQHNHERLPGEAEQLEHRFEKAGTYEVRLKLWSDYGSYSLASATVTVRPHEEANPEAKFSVSSPEGAPRETFDAQPSAPGTCNTIAHYLWNWGDGSAIEEDSAPVVTHTYPASVVPQSYAVSLTVLNSEFRRSATIRQTVVVNPPEAPPMIPSEPGPPLALPRQGASSTVPGPRRGPTYVSPRASFAGGVLAVSVSCPAARISCAGTVQAETAAAFPDGRSSTAKGGARRRASRLVLGQAGFRVTEGHRETVTVRLTPRGAALLRRLRRLPVLVIVSAHDAAGDPGVQRVHLTLAALAAGRHNAPKGR